MDPPVAASAEDDERTYAGESLHRRNVGEGTTVPPPPPTDAAAAASEEGGGGHGPIPPPLSFSFPSHGDGMVLQRGPGAASVHGTLGTGPGPCESSVGGSGWEVTVLVFRESDLAGRSGSGWWDGGASESESEGADDDDGDGSAPPALYSVRAEVYREETGTGGSASGFGGLRRCAFRALLRPAAAGGSYAIVARGGPPPPSSSSWLGAARAGAAAVLRNVTFGDVWYCAGQSNMGLPLEYTSARNESAAAVREGRYDDVRISALPDEWGPARPWSTARDALEDGTFLRFSATCWHFAERLADELRRERGGRDGGGVVDGGDGSVVPIGLIHASVGGSTIEEWFDDASRAGCADVCPSKPVAMLRGQSPYSWSVLPYVNTTVRGFLWYQGENNMGGGPRTCVLGNSLFGSGYSCLMVELVRRFRDLWSAAPGTTDPLAPFGVVALPRSGSEGNPNMGTFRWAQTGGYGVLPNAAMPNTFLVQSYDVDDPYQRPYDFCVTNKCCLGQCEDKQFMKERFGFECRMCPDLCGDFCASVAATKFYMGPIHPREKREIGARLGLAAARSSYGAGGERGGAATGPTLAGCRIDEPGDSDEAAAGSGVGILRLFFDSTLLNGDFVHVQEYNRSRPGLSKLEVLVVPVDENAGEDGDLMAPNGDKWAPVDILTEGRASGGGLEVRADLSGLPEGAVAHAVRYAWDGTCCDGGNPDNPGTLEAQTRYCPPKSCPIYARPSGLPANPFLAEIVQGRCRCVPPQTCDAAEVPSPAKTGGANFGVGRGEITFFSLGFLFSIAIYLGWRSRPKLVEEQTESELVPLRQEHVED